MAELRTQRLGNQVQLMAAFRPIPEPGPQGGTMTANDPFRNLANLYRGPLHMVSTGIFKASDCLL